MFFFYSKRLIVKSGYHYTSLENWNRIKNEGIQLYEISKPCFEKDLGFSSIQGIWVWRNNPQGMSHVGSIIYQISKKGCYEVVKLRLTFPVKDVFRVTHGKVILYHKGELEALTYHDREEAEIVIEPIQPKRIELMAVYDIREQFSESTKTQDMPALQELHA